MCDKIYQILQKLDVFDKPLTINLGDSQGDWGTKQLHELKMAEDKRATLIKMHTIHCKHVSHQSDMYKEGGQHDHESSFKSVDLSLDDKKMERE